MAEEPSLSYYLPIAGGRIIGFIPFPRVLVLCEMQSVSSRIWTRIAVFISYGDNDYITGTSIVAHIWFTYNIRGKTVLWKRLARILFSSFALRTSFNEIMPSALILFS